MADQSTHNRTGGAAKALWAFLGTLLVLEAIIDIIALPADEVLIPGEAIMDGIIALVAVIDMVGTRFRGSRQIRASRRGILGRGLRSNRLGAAHSWIAEVVVWGAFAGMVVYAWWFSIHHPILWILVGLPALIVIGIVGLVALTWTIGSLLVRQRNGGYRQSRQVGQ